jgi:Asp-tRNA(Asn)/Glu-tRNA(Gln) amidotransferase A subunit family amidase
LTRTPGGSSGGTGAGLAANFGVVGIGTDTVNSIRSPSSANSLVGIRPTRGLVSRAGVVPYSHTQDMAGPLARTVADAAKVLETIAGYDPKDRTTAWSVGKSPRFSSFLDADGLKSARLGVLSSFLGTGPEHDEVNAVMETALQALRDSGAHLVTLEDNIDADELIRDVSVGLFELDADLSAYLKERGAPVGSLSEILASGKFEPVLKNVYERALETDSAEYRNRLLKRPVLREQLVAIMADHRLDAIVYPHQKRLVVPIGEDQVDRNGVLASVTGFPAITVPAGFSPPTDSAPLGVPVGIEFLGRPWSEGELLRIAYAFEQATHFRRPPRSTPPLQ